MRLLEQNQTDVHGADRAWHLRYRKMSLKITITRNTFEIKYKKLKKKVQINSLEPFFLTQKRDRPIL